MGMGEKTRNIYKAKTKERIPRLFALLSPRLRKYGGRVFSGVWKHQKQAGPTLGGTGSLV